MTASDPNWDELPSDPVAFFKLSSGYDRRELKSAYTKLIRVYKPERYPDEFKQIRAAYDLLNDRLRYMGRQAELDESAANGQEVQPDEDTEEFPALDALAIFKEQGARAAVDALAAAPILSGPAWCHLALLQDELGEDPLVFQRLLIEGVRQSNASGATFQLLLASLQEELSMEQRASLVEDLLPLACDPRSPLRPETYWYLSEALWIGLAQSMSFTKFAELFERCSKEVGESGWSGRVVLLLRLVRKVALVGDAEWLANSMRELGDAYHQMGPWDQHSLDVLDWLIAYRDQRPDLSNAHPIITGIDSALAAIVTGDEVQADRLFLAAQVACLDQREALFGLFPQGQHSGVVVDALRWHADGVAERNGNDRWADDEEGMLELARGFASRLTRRTSRSSTAIVRWLIRPWFTALVAVVLLVPWTVLLVAEDLSGFWWSVPILVTVGVILGFARGWFASADARFQAPFVRRLHRKIWRDLTADFLADSHVPIELVVSEIAKVQEHSAAIAFCSETISQDEGLRLYSIAQRFAE